MPRKTKKKKKTKISCTSQKKKECIHKGKICNPQSGRCKNPTKTKKRH